MSSSVRLATHVSPSLLSQATRGDTVPMRRRTGGAGISSLLRPSSACVCVCHYCCVGGDNVVLRPQRVIHCSVPSVPDRHCAAGRFAWIWS